MTDIKYQNFLTKEKQNSTSAWGCRGFYQPVCGDVTDHMETAMTGLTGQWAKIMK